MIKASFEHIKNSKIGEFSLKVDFELTSADFVAITGKSGAGKTSLLRVLAGLESVQAGRISGNNQIWVDTQNGEFAAPQKRAIGYVSQGYDLFPNMSGLENLQFAQIQKENLLVDELIDMMEMKDFVNKRIHQLSGGQQQRIALARALIRRPELLLLDEPLSALDKELRLKLQSYLSKIHEQYQLTTMIVTHDISEIRNLANKVMVLSEGRCSEFVNAEDYLMNFKSRTDLSLKILDKEMASDIPILVLETAGDPLRIMVTIRQWELIKIGEDFNFKAETHE